MMGQSPLLELVHRGVDMARDVVPEVLAHQSHEVVPRVPDVVFGLVLVPLHAHVAVDRVQALRDGAAAFDVRLLDADDLEVASPVPGFVCGAAAGHPPADHQDVRIHGYRFPPVEESH